MTTAAVAEKPNCGFKKIDLIIDFFRIKIHLNKYQNIFGLMWNSKRYF